MSAMEKVSLANLIKKHNLVADEQNVKVSEDQMDSWKGRGLNGGDFLSVPMEPMSRSRGGSISSIADEADSKFGEELFNHCKHKLTDAKASSGILLKELEHLGIFRDDPRLKGVMKTLQNMTSSYGISNIKLSKDQFTKMIKENPSLISKAFKGQLVIPDFDSFTKDITQIYERCKDNRSGKPAGYIPQLARGDPEKWGVSLCTIDGQRFNVGDVHDKFSIQSTSKTFTYAICLDQLGAEVVQKYIGREPSGRNFNEIVLDYNGQPHNPMINSGAIMSAALLLYLVKPEMSISEKYEYVHEFFIRTAGYEKVFKNFRMAGYETVGFQNSTFLSERNTADRNQALAYFMREYNCFPTGPNNDGSGVDIKNILDFYFQTCSMEMSASSMSVLAGTLANGGICPITGERVLSCEAVKSVLSLMFSCGMYNYSGQFAFQVGLPAKSGVSGIVLVIVPNVVGFALWSPPLDAIGNSARGVMFAEELVKIYSFHTFDGIGGAMSGKKNPMASRIDGHTSDLLHILTAAANGDQLALETAHLSGVDMNLADYDSRTALHLAVAENRFNCIKYLIQTCKVDLEFPDRWGNTAMMDALSQGKTKVIALLKREQLRRRQMSRSSNSLPEEDTESLCESPRKMSAASPSGGEKNGFSINGNGFSEEDEDNVSMSGSDQDQEDVAAISGSIVNLVISHVD